MKHSLVTFLSSIIIPSSAVFNLLGAALFSKLITSQNNVSKLIKKARCNERVGQLSLDNKCGSMSLLGELRISKEVACNLNQNALNSFANPSKNSLSILLQENKNLS